MAEGLGGGAPSVKSHRGRRTTTVNNIAFGVELRTLARRDGDILPDGVTRNREQTILG